MIKKHMGSQDLTFAIMKTEASSWGGCCASVVAGVMEEPTEQYGHPHNQIPARMFANGGGYGALAQVK